MLVIEYGVLLQFQISNFISDVVLMEQVAPSFLFVCWGFAPLSDHYQ
jgi:hypothetical protein